MNRSQTRDKVASMIHTELPHPENTSDEAWRQLCRSLANDVMHVVMEAYLNAAIEGEKW